MPEISLHVPRRRRSLLANPFTAAGWFWLGYSGGILTAVLAVLLAVS